VGRGAAGATGASRRRAGRGAGAAEGEPPPGRRRAGAWARGEVAGRAAAGSRTRRGAGARSVGAQETCAGEKDGVGRGRGGSPRGPNPAITVSKT
jgi:hypothetical protein